VGLPWKGFGSDRAYSRTAFLVCLCLGSLAVGHTVERARVFDFGKHPVYIDSGVLFTWPKWPQHTIFGLSELITNSLTHAFPSRRVGVISIAPGEDRYRLVYADDGVGMPESFDFRASPMLGMNLILRFGEQQLGGSVKFESDRGLHCTIDFPKTRKPGIPSAFDGASSIPHTTLIVR
jgi:hypothetical protein